MEFNPKKFTGEHAQEIFAEVLEANNTEKKNLIRSLDNIKYETVVTTVSGEIGYSDYKEDIQEADHVNYTDNVVFSDAVITPKKIMALTFVTMDQLRNTRFASSMPKGAANIGSTDFEKAMLGHCIPRLGKAFEKRQWASITAATKAAIAAGASPVAEKAWAAAQTAQNTDGLLARLIAYDGNNISVVGTVLTQSNLAAEFAKVFSATPSEVRDAVDFCYFTDYTVKGMILLANQAREFRDIFMVEGTGPDMKFYFLNKPIEFVPLPANTILAGRGMASGDFISATDLMSDVTSLEIGKVNNVGDKMFMKQVCTLDTHIVVPTQKVIYKG